MVLQKYTPSETVSTHIVKFQVATLRILRIEYKIKYLTAINAHSFIESWVKELQA